MPSVVVMDRILLPIGVDSAGASTGPPCHGASIFIVLTGRSAGRACADTSGPRG